MLDDGTQSIELHKQEVARNIHQINNNSLEYEFNSYLTKEICSNSRDNTYTAYQRWLLFYPLLQIFMANEEKIHANIYHNAVVEGCLAELQSHKESKEMIEVSKHNNS